MSSRECHFSFPLLFSELGVLGYEDYRASIVDEARDGVEVAARPIINSFGREVLGCMLGQESMPSTCSTFPFSAEIDFPLGHTVEHHLKAREKSKAQEMAQGEMRLRETAWFEGLVHDLRHFLPISSILDEGIKEKYTRILLRVFFNFDTTRSAIRRPVRSWARLKTEMSASAWALARATKHFILKGEESGAEEYILMCDRLGVD